MPISFSTSATLCSSTSSSSIPYVTRNVTPVTHFRYVHEIKYCCRPHCFVLFLIFGAVTPSTAFIMLLTGKEAGIFILAVTIRTITAGLTITLVSRQFTSVPQDIDVNLTRLNLNSNNISRLTKLSLRNFIFLQDLYMVANDLRVIEDGAFDNNPRLKLLYLDQNKLEKIPISFGSAESSLEKIHLQDALQEEVYVNFNLTGLRNLNYLNIQKNANLPNHVFTTLPGNIEFLYMAECNLKYIPPGNLENLKNLAFMYIEQNQLQTVPDLYDLPLTFIYLGGNPLECNKSLCWIRMWDLTKPRPLLHLGVCATPGHLAGRQLQAVDPAVLRCFEGKCCISSGECKYVWKLTAPHITMRV